MKNQSVFRRAQFALQGLCDSLRSEKSFRAQVAVFFGVIVLLLIMRPAAVWWALLLGVSGMMMAVELINTAVEKLVDHLHPDQHEVIRIVKDTLAAAVMVTCVTGALVLVAFVWRYTQ